MAANASGPEAKGRAAGAGKGEEERVADPLAGDDLRGPRLEIDYLGPELALRRHGITQTIVVFGSSRVPDPDTAKARLARLRQMRSEIGDSDPLLDRRIAVAEAHLRNSVFYTIAQDFGRLVGRIAAASPERLAVMTGGGPGLMEAANRGAHDAGAVSIGLNIILPQLQETNPYVTGGLGFDMRYFAIRKLHLLLRAKALVAFPGGYGTLDELFETLNLVQTRRINPLPVILVGQAFWQRAFDVKFLLDEGVLGEGDDTRFTFAETAEGIWQSICDWYDQRGLPRPGSG